MKKIIFALLPASLLLSTVACNNNTKKPENNAEVKTKADTLMEDVMDGHNVAMGKMGRLTRTEQEITRLLDSLGKLPARTQEAAALYKAKLNTLLVDLKSAEDNMNKWMEEFNMDSAVNNVEERIKYLGSEKGKVTQVKEAILNGLQKADSVLKQKF